MRILLYLYTWRRTIMAYTINSDCINCGACVEACPVDCIAPGDEIYVIDPDACIDCGACVDACPVDAIQAP